MSGYLQSNALGLVMPKDQSLGSTLGGLGLSSLHGAQGLLPSNHLSSIVDQMKQRDASIPGLKIGEGQSKNQFQSGISMQQAAENDPFGYGRQEYDPGEQYGSIYQTGGIIG